MSTCQACTFFNEDPALKNCAICRTPLSISEAKLGNVAEVALARAKDFLQSQRNGYDLNLGKIDIETQSIEIREGQDGNFRSISLSLLPPHLLEPDSKWPDGFDTECLSFLTENKNATIEDSLSFVNSYLGEQMSGFDDGGGEFMDGFGDADIEGFGDGFGDGDYDGFGDLGDGDNVDLSGFVADVDPDEVFGTESQDRKWGSNSEQVSDSTWVCGACTLVNESKNTKCSVCNELRPLKPRVTRSKSYTILSPKRIENEAEAFVTKCSVDLGTSKPASAVLLRAAKWNLTKLSQVWEDATEKKKLVHKAGLRKSLYGQIEWLDDSKDYTCPVCWCEGPGSEFFSLKCKHPACRECYIDYIKNAVSTGTAAGDTCIDMTCPQDDCQETLTLEVFEMLTPDCITKYKQFIVKSFVEDNNGAVWCPGKGCSNAVAYSERKRRIVCECGTSFCWRCSTPSHWPASCEEAKKWNDRDSDGQSLDAKYFLEQTKPCPKCRTPTNKDGGCMYMTCKICSTNWCWQCGKGDHHVWECNRPEYAYGSESADNPTDMQKYLFYYERFFNHKHSGKLAETQRQRIRKVMDKLTETGKFTWLRVQFLGDAVELVIQCRNVIAWSYAKAFYLETEQEIRLFQFHQTQLEEFTEYLNEMVEREDDSSLYDDDSRKKIMSWTESLHTFLANIEAETSV